MTFFCFWLNKHAAFFFYQHWFLDEFYVTHCCVQLFGKPAVLIMPKKRVKLAEKTPKFSLRASCQKNSEQHDLGLTYPTADRSGSHVLRDLKQISYPELCEWGPKVCKTYLWDHGVLSADVPLCWYCGEDMIRTGRRMDDELKCGGTNCYGHPVLQRPVEAFTPLHSQVRQGEDADYVNFLRCCYCIGIRTPPDALRHLLTGVSKNRLTRWTQDIRLACAVAEYQDSSSFEFGAGVLEFDTATAVVRRNASKLEMTQARLKRSKVERKGLQSVKKTVRKMLRKRPASKCSSKKIFKGRHIVFKLRTVNGIDKSRKYAIPPLPPKAAERGLFL